MSNPMEAVINLQQPPAPSRFDLSRIPGAR